MLFQTKELNMGKIPRMNLAAQVERQIKDFLMVGMLKPGERLVTRNIAEQLGISITPVREALLQLVSSGALVALPAQAFLVPEMTLSSYKEITAVRKKLETMAVREAASAITPGELATLHQLFVVLRDANIAGNAEQSLQANCAFRFQLYAYAAMPTLLTLIEQLWVRTGPSFNYLYPLTCEIQINHNYESLLNALYRKDDEKCAEIIAKSIDYSATILTERLWSNRLALSS
jgi:GntR family colanic acid and biofilm gene transcriptional regulator